jgi:hypothetical protein
VVVWQLRRRNPWDWVLVKHLIPQVWITGERTR